MGSGADTITDQVEDDLLMLDAVGLGFLNRPVRRAMDIG